jgi:hypothetical protein
LFDNITHTNSTVIGFIALKVLLPGHATAWSPQDLNIATPHNGVQDFANFLHNLPYKITETRVKISLVAGATTNSVYTNPHGKIITLMESKESDSFLGITAGSNYTASINFISSKYNAALYPIQSLMQQTTYAYCYPLDASTAANIVDKGYSIISDSISHPTECCPIAHCQFATLAGIGLLQWCNNNNGNLLTTSYSW